MSKKENKEVIKLSEETAIFLMNMLNSFSLKVGDPGFNEAVNSINRAKSELIRFIMVKPAE